ncbi:hypothetical protein DRO37_02600 [Candidatus Bathyarchaeota archaeon]|nr:MAG: hypothetical protein DRO37_02600 [Candidatus Bathyarchaeota archaeon]
MSEEYKRRYTFGADYGTSDFKFGPITCGETPEIIENRGYFPDTESLMYRIMGTPKEVVVGKEIPLYLGSREDLTLRMVYPMKNGIIRKDDERAWRVVYEITKYGLKSFKPPEKEFDGFYVVASLSSIAPRYMYERLFEIYRQIDEEEKLVKAVTIIPQPLAVAIAQKIPTCVVLESGHGNTQVCPISRYPIRNAVVAINRGGGDANSITAEILKDCGYGDLAREEAFVRRIKEEIGLIPKDLTKAVEAAKKNPERFRVIYRVPNTRIEIDLAENSWTRFLIGEYVFNPNHELFHSYFSRGMPKPEDARIGDITFRGMIDFGESIIESVERCPIELQPYLYGQILLSGGNFAWKVPREFRDVATDSALKIRLLLEEKGIRNAKIVMTKDPQFSVWRGCIVYGYAVPEDYEWNWERMEGWLKFRE